MRLGHLTQAARRYLHARTADTGISVEYSVPKLPDNARCRALPTLGLMGNRVQQRCELTATRIGTPCVSQGPSGRPAGESAPSKQVLDEPLVVAARISVAPSVAALGG